VRTKSHTGGKFSETTLGLLCTRVIVLLCKYIAVFRCGVRWRHSKPPNSGPHFWSFITSLRKDSVANYASIWTPFSPSVRGFDVLYNALIAANLRILWRHLPMEIGRWRHKIRKFAAEIFQNAKKSAAELCQILRIVTSYIVINSAHV